MEKVRPWCGQPSDRGRLRNRTEHSVMNQRRRQFHVSAMHKIETACMHQVLEVQRQWNKLKLVRTTGIAELGMSSIFVTYSSEPYVAFSEFAYILGSLPWWLVRRVELQSLVLNKVRRSQKTVCYRSTDYSTGRSSSLYPLYPCGPKSGGTMSQLRRPCMEQKKVWYHCCTVKTGYKLQHICTHTWRSELCCLARQWCSSSKEQGTDDRWGLCCLCCQLLWQSASYDCRSTARTSMTDRCRWQQILH